jgi:hypothetical protein
MPGTFQHAGALHIGRRRDDHDGVDLVLPAGLEQQRDVEHDDAGTARFVLADEAIRDRAHQRMHDRFELLDRLRPADESFGELAAIDSSLDRDAGKRRLDRRDRLALIEAVHHGVGIMHRHAGLAEETRGDRFAHADRAGEAEDEHITLRSWRECRLPESRAVPPSRSA